MLQEKLICFRPVNAAAKRGERDGEADFEGFGITQEYGGPLQNLLTRGVNPQVPSLRAVVPAAAGSSDVEAPGLYEGDETAVGPVCESDAPGAGGVR